MSDIYGLKEMVDVVESAAVDYESAIDDLIDAASNADSLDMSQTVVYSTNVQVESSILEMAQGVTKNATDQVKKQGTNVSR
jgi:hypothetical protein